MITLTYNFPFPKKQLQERSRLLAVMRVIS